MLTEEERQLDDLREELEIAVNENPDRGGRNLFIEYDHTAPKCDFCFIELSIHGGGQGKTFYSCLGCDLQVTRFSDGTHGRLTNTRDPVAHLQPKYVLYTLLHIDELWEPYKED